MPMEHIRKRVMEDTSLYPEFRGLRQQSEAAPISIASTTSTSSTNSVAVTRPAALRGIFKKSTIVISSDEEDELEADDDRPSDDTVEITEVSRKNPLPSRTASQSQTQQVPKFVQKTQPDVRTAQPTWPAGSGVPIRVPQQADRPHPSKPAVPPTHHSNPENMGDDEEVKLPDFQNDDTILSPAEAEKALRDLMSGAMNQDLDSDIDIDMSQEVVDGFKEGVKLLPHQILGRAWMKDREDPSKKRAGGILADDMGLGKTIQTLNRIVEGRAKRPDKEAGWSASTLVICPLALVEQWASEVTKMTNLRVLKHHGSDRTTDPAVLQKQHIVVTTYDTVKSEYAAFNPAAKNESKSSSKASSSKELKDSDDNSDSTDFGHTAKRKTTKASKKKSALYGVRWWRIVLDEAHNIKNVKTKGAIACCELQGKFRWCLTGTPMQNNVTELYSFLKFLRIKPLSNWDTFNQQIAKPVNKGRGAGRAMKRLQVVLKQVMLRRRKDQLLNGEVLIKLPKRNVDIVSCEFDAVEREFYDSLEEKMKEALEELMAKKEKGNSYIGALTLLLRLRQACDHPILVSKDYKGEADALEPSVQKGKDDNDLDPDDLVAAFEQMGVVKKCQMCTTEIPPNHAGDAEWDMYCRDCIPLAAKAKEMGGKRPTSAKIRMVLKLLREIDQRSNSEEKTIIFSQFTSMLDLLEPFLKADGIKFARYDGSMNPMDREASLKKIKTSSSTRVILISFKAGSTGLNLTACNNVILVDLWWNPALEDQAFDRAHRFGQTRDVNIFKLKIDETVEDHILRLQEKKRALAAAALSGNKIKNMRLGMEELLALFRPGGDTGYDEEDF